MRSSPFLVINPIILVGDVAFPSGESETESRKATAAPPTPALAAIVLCPVGYHAIFADSRGSSRHRHAVP